MSILEDMPRPLLLVSPEGGDVLDANLAAREWFGRSQKKLQKISLAKLVRDVEDIDQLVARVHAEQAPVELRDIKLGERAAGISLFPADGNVAVLILPIRAASGRHMRGRSVHTLGQMIGHELKNPLAGIKGAAQLLRSDATDPESHDLLDLITSEIDRIRRLADRLQTFGESDGDHTRVNIHTVLRNARKIMAPGSGTVFFTEDYDPSLPHIQGDADSVMQVVVNLIKNAVEAMGDAGGEIVLRTRSRSGVRRGNSHLPIELQVIDDGPGLPIHMRDRVFEPFVTSKPSGQGLGLALVAKVVEGHGGIVEVESQPGRTAFSLLLPAAPQPKEPA